MEPSTSPELINNIATTVILNFNFQVLVNILLYSAAATTGVVTASKLLTLVFEEFIRGFRHKWTTRYNDRRELAREITKILTEGSTTGWNIPPRDIEHIYFIANLIEATDVKANELFNTVVSSWSLNALTQEKQNPSKENIEFCQNLQSRAQTATKELKQIISKWN